MTSATSDLRIETLAVGASDSDRAFRLEVDHLEVQSGDVIGVSGPSGTGKTMLLEVLGLLRRPFPGSTYRVRTPDLDVDLAAMWEKGRSQSDAPALRGSLFGFVPQSGGLLPFLSVAENIAVSQRIAGRIDDAWQRSLEEKLGLDHLRKLLPQALSIGQRQRVAIARALAHRPAFVIADEPTAALDPDNATTVLKMFMEAAEIGGAAVVISSHDLDLLDSCAPRRLRLELEPTGDAGQVLSRVREMAVEGAA